MSLHRHLIPLLVVVTLLVLLLPSGLERTTLPEAPPDDAPKADSSPSIATPSIDSDRLPDQRVDISAPDSTPLPVHQLAPDTWFLYGNIAQVDTDNRGWNGNAGFIVTDAGVVVIDALGTPYLGRRLIATIRSVTDQPIRYLILTHNHPDHSYGAVAFKELGGVAIVAHAGTLDYLASEAIIASVEYRREILPADMAGFEAVRPDILVDGEPFEPYGLELGGQRFTVYNVGRHHSYGDLVVHQEQANIVWISDLAFNHRTTFMGDGHSAEALAGIDWLLANFADATLMVPGHGSAQSAPFPMVTQTRDYIARLRQVMAEAIENGVDMQEAIEAAGFADWEGVRLYEENHPRNAHFVYGEMEQELF